MALAREALWANLATKIREIQGQLSTAFRLSGDIERAEGILRREVDLCRTDADKYRLSIALCRLGTAYLKANKPGEALTYFQRSLDIDNEIGHEVSKGYNLYKMAQCANLTGNHQAAADLARQARTQFSALGEQRPLMLVEEFLRSLEKETHV